MNRQTAAKITRERARQNEKWGTGGFAAMAPERVLAVLMEEVGELARALLEFKHHPNLAPIEEELTHVAAVAARWLDECFTRPGDPQ